MKFKVLLLTILFSINSVINAQLYNSTLVKDFNSITLIGQLNNKLIFYTDEGWWVTDGSKSGEVKLNIPDYGANSVSFKNSIYYTYKPDWQVAGVQIWKTDGTEIGTKKTITLPLAGDINSMFAIEERFFFIVKLFNSQTKEIWVSDGTESGTAKLVSADGTLFQDLWGFTRLSDKVYFRYKEKSTGEEIWVTDGTVSGTKIVKDLNEGAGSGIQGNFPKNSMEMGGYLYFEGYQDNNNYGLFRTDGTENGTTLVSNNCYGNGRFEGAIVIDNVMYFQILSKTIPIGSELWRSDGTSNGTYLISDIKKGTSSGMYHLNNFKKINDKFLFTADDGTNGFELWISDGTESGTQILKNINQKTSGTNSSIPWFEKSNTIMIKGNLIFTADDGLTGREIWVTDGTANGTKIGLDVDKSSYGTEPKSFEFFNDELYFICSNATGKLQSIRKISEATNSIAKLKNELDFTLFPNPIKDILTVKLNNYQKTASIRLFNNSGIEIFNTQMNFSLEEVSQIDLINLEKGIYMVKMTIESGQTFTSKIIK